MLSDVEQSWGFAKAVELENKQHQTAGEKCRKERKRNCSQVKDVVVAKVALECASKVAGAYDTRWYKLNEKL